MSSWDNTTTMMVQAAVVLPRCACSAATVITDRYTLTMASTETVPIGASVIEYIHRNDRQAPAEPLLEGVQVDDGGSSTLQQQQECNSVPPSLIPCNGNSNILLKGPRRSGTSSIAMNMAHSIASSCCLQSQTACPRGTCASTCTCVAVSILTPLIVHNNHQNNNHNNTVQDEHFPLPCNVVQDESLDFYGQLRALQSTNNDKTPTWNKAALKRIQVHRMASIRNVMEFLLSLSSNNKSSPVGSIVLQDLDVFVRGNNNANGTGEELSTEQLMTMTQILALLADTANVVRSSGDVRSFVVLVTMTDGGVPWNVYRLWSTWFSLSLKIRPCSSTSTLWKSPLLQEEERVESSFVLEQLEQVGSGKRCEERPMDVPVAHYAIVRQDNNSDGCLRIVWKREMNE